MEGGRGEGATGVATVEAEAEAGSDVLTGVTRGGAGLVTGDLVDTFAADSGGD